jgi:hypothetical protein
LASQGIDKNLAHQARTLGALSEERFEVVGDARDAVTRAVKLKPLTGNLGNDLGITRPTGQAGSLNRLSGVGDLEQLARGHLMTMTAAFSGTCDQIASGADVAP